MLHTFDTTSKYTARRARRNSLEQEWQEQASARIFSDEELMEGDESNSSKANSLRFARQLVLDDTSSGTEDDDDSVRTFDYNQGRSAHSGRVNLYDLEGAEPATYSTRHGRGPLMRCLTCWTENVQLSKRTYIILAVAFAILIAIVVGQSVGQANRDASKNVGVEPVPTPAPIHNLPPHRDPLPDPEVQQPDEGRDPDTFTHDLVSSLLMHFGILDITKLADSTSPQRLAVNYLVGSTLSETKLDRDHMRIEDWEQKPELRSLVELYSLAVLYHSTAGEEWLQDTRWLQPDLHDACAWYGVKCGAGNAVTQLQLPANGLIGDLPTEIQYLKSLTTLDLSNNELNGVLPQAIPPSLEFLQLSQNRFESSIPIWNEATSLLVLDVHENDLRGSVVGTTWESLTVLDVSHNFLTGTLPTLPHLQRLLANNNRFSRWPSTMSSLRELEVRENHFEGTIDTLGQPALAVLDVSQNGLKGKLDFALELPNLQEFKASQNQFTGTMPLGLAPSLTSLVASHNHLNGFIKLGGLVNLSVLDLGHNGFDSSIPPALSALAGLKLLDLSNNALIGSIPSITSPQLETLHLHVNQLTGNVPASLTGISTLLSVKLEENSLTGDVPFCGLETLTSDCEAELGEAELTCSCCTYCF